LLVSLNENVAFRFYTSFREFYLFFCSFVIRVGI